MVSLLDPYTGNGCSWRPGWRCAPSFRLSVKSHLREEEEDTVRWSPWRQVYVVFMSGGFLTVWSPGCAFAHGSIQSDLQVEVAHICGCLKVNVPPRAPPVGANQGRRVGSRFSQRASLEKGEQERQQGVLHPDPSVYVHWSKTRRELLEVFRCSVVPKLGDSSYLKPPKCHSCSHPLRKK